MSSAVSEAVPFLDLSDEFKALEQEWIAAIRATGKSGRFILGDDVGLLEKEIAQYTGTAHAISLANGTDALTLSLRALDIGPGDEVITTPFTFFATAEVISHVGATPVFADINPDSFNLDPESVRAKITARTKAILPVHLFGNPTDMTAMMDIARESGLAVVEDSAQAFGAAWGEYKVGSMGDTGCFSFYPTKVLGCYGDGGMITTNREDIKDHLLRLRNHGAVKPFVHDEIGYNSRLDTIQASLLRVKLKKVDKDIRHRREVAALYTELLKDTGVITPTLPDGGQHVFNLYTVRVKNRDQARQHLTDHNIATSLCYPMPLHLQAVYKNLGYQPGDLPVCEQLAYEVLSLPVFPAMKKEQVKRVCEVLTSTP